MDLKDWLMLAAAIVLTVQSLWIWRLTGKYHGLLEELSRAGAKMAQHKALINELDMLIRDDEDLDRCLQEEVDAKIAETARDVRYEQNKVRYDMERPESPWVPKVNPK